MPHILVAGLIHDAGLRALDSAPGFTHTMVSDPAAAAFHRHLPEADALLIRTQPLAAAAIATAPRLRIVARHGVGFDAIDVNALSARRIPLAIVGEVNSRAVAEHTLMLMLAAARRVVAHDHAARRGGWTVRDSFETVELDGKTLLLVGFGRIGRRVGELALAIGMRLLVHDPHVAESTIIEAGATTAPDLDAALAAADVITLHLPASPQGPLIDARRLALMKPSAILVNAARGGLIDETALDLALRAGRLHGAALDVLAGEPPAPAHPLLVNERLTLSPHAAGLTGECAARMAVAAVRNILDFFAGTLDGALVVNRDALAP